MRNKTVKCSLVLLFISGWQIGEIAKTVTRSFNHLLATRRRDGSMGGHMVKAQRWRSNQITDYTDVIPAATSKSLFLSKMIRLRSKQRLPFLSLTHTLVAVYWTGAPGITLQRCKNTNNISTDLDKTRKWVYSFNRYLQYSKWIREVFTLKQHYTKVLLSSRWGGCSHTHSAAVYMPFCPHHCWHSGGERRPHGQLQRYWKWSMSQRSSRFVIFHLINLCLGCRYFHLLYPTFSYTVHTEFPNVTVCIVCYFYLLQIALVAKTPNLQKIPFAWHLMTSENYEKQVKAKGDIKKFDFIQMVQVLWLLIFSLFYFKNNVMRNVSHFFFIVNKIYLAPLKSVHSQIMPESSKT